MNLYVCTSVWPNRWYIISQSCMYLVYFACIVSWRSSSTSTGSRLACWKSSRNSAWCRSLWSLSTETSPRYSSLSWWPTFYCTSSQWSLLSSWKTNMIWADTKTAMTCRHVSNCTSILVWVIPPTGIVSKDFEHRIPIVYLVRFGSHSGRVRTVNLWNNIY